MDKNSHYGLIYNEICKGYTSDFLNEVQFFFKHPSLSEYFNLYNTYDINKKHAEKKGVLSENDKIAECIQNNWWSQQNESKLNLLQKTVQNLYKTKEKLLYPSQKEDIDKQIKKTNHILITLIKERNDLVGYTSEKYAEDKFVDNLIINLTYKDVSFKEKFFTKEEDFYNLSDSDCTIIKNIFHKINGTFAIDILKKIAANGFFQNLIYLNSDPFLFWGKPTVQCSKYQIDLLVYGKIYRKFIESYQKNGESIPEEILGDADKLIDFIENKKNDSLNNKFKKTKTKDKDNTISSFVGASKKDLDSMGVKVEKLKGKSILELAREKGGTLEKSDYFNARENR